MWTLSSTCLRCRAAVLRSFDSPALVLSIRPSVKSVSDSKLSFETGQKTSASVCSKYSSWTWCWRCVNVCLCPTACCRVTDELAARIMTFKGRENVNYPGHGDVWAKTDGHGRPTWLRTDARGHQNPTRKLIQHKPWDLLFTIVTGLCWLLVLHTISLNPHTHTHSLSTVDIH